MPVHGPVHALATACLALIPCPGDPLERTAPDPGAWEGTWRGTVAPGGATPFVLELRLAADGGGVASLQTVGYYERPLARRGEDFEFEVYGQAVRLGLAREGETLRGRWDGWGVLCDLALARVGDGTPGFLTEDLEIAAQGASLRATLLVPEGEGPHDVIVWTHGSGPITRADPVYRGLAQLAVEEGLASLIYDKRAGSELDFADLADDAVAGVRHLQQESFWGAVGVGGISQGGWVAPMAAARSEEVDFVVTLSAPGISPADQNIFNQRNRLERAHGPAAAAEASALIERVYASLRGAEPWSAVETALAAAREAPWFTNAFEVAYWSRNGRPADVPAYLALLDHDPLPTWARVRVPVLNLWGEDDLLVPAALSALRIGGVLAEAGNRAVDHLLLPGADHVLQLPPEAPWTQGRRHPGLSELGERLEALLERD